MNPLVRRLLLAATAILATSASGIVEGTVPEAPEDSTEPAVHANNHFAVDLSGQLTKENAGENLFFSPYSISTALAMTAEGARGETALEMGRVLCFPDSTRLKSDDLPWDLRPIHTGMAELQQLFSGQPKPDQAEIRTQIDELRQRLEAAHKRTAEVQKARNWQVYRKAAVAEGKIASQLNSLLAQVDQYELRVANAPPLSTF